MDRPSIKLFKPKWPTHTLALKERHYLILEAVGNYKYLTNELGAALLMRLVQPPKVKGKPTGEVIRRAMTELFNYGYLARPMIQVQFRQAQRGSHKMVYTLTPKGKAALELQDPNASQFFVAPSRRATTPAMLHTLMIARFRATLAALTHNHPDHYQISQWQQGQHLKSTVTVEGRKTPVVPDGFMTIKLLSQPTGKQQTHFFLEADRSTMPLKRFKRKLLAYQTYHETSEHTRQHKIKGFRVLTITLSPERRDNLRNLAAGLGMASAFYFACEKDFDPFKPETILKPIWVTGKHKDPQALLPI
jgi:hypothetical protein